MVTKKELKNGTYSHSQNVLINRFCEIPENKFRKWDEVDVMIWKLTRNKFQSQSGAYYLNAYKDTYVRYNKDKIINHANEAGIPPELLGGVAWIESGGMPENLKFQVFEMKRMINHETKPADRTSFGSVAIQLRVAAQTLGLDPSSLTTRDQLELATCLMEDDFNLHVVANHLRDVMLYDYPDAATLYPTNEQFIMAGIRYNRGMQRKLENFIDLINFEPARDSSEYEYISYGMRLEKIKAHIQKLLQ